MLSIFLFFQLQTYYYLHYVRYLQYNLLTPLILQFSTYATIVQECGQRNHTGSLGPPFPCVLVPGSSKKQVTLEMRMKVSLRSVGGVIIDGFVRDIWEGKLYCTPISKQTTSSRYLLAVSVYSFLLFTFSLKTMTAWSIWQAIAARTHWYRQNSIKWPPIKRPPLSKQPAVKVLKLLPVKYCK